jgi:hypothetical protein
MKRLRIPILVLFIFTLILATAAAQDGEMSEVDEDFLWENPELITVPDEKVAFDDESYRHMKNQSVYFMAQLDNGWVVMLSYFWIVPRGGIFQSWGIYVTVTDPEGNAVFFKEKLKNRDMTFEEDSLYLSDGGRNVVQGDGNFYHAKLNIEGFACDLSFVNVLPPWEPGDGMDYISRDKTAFTKRVVFSPWADVLGTITVSGEKMDVTGQGFAEKQLTVNRFNKLNPFLYAIRVFSPPETPKDERIRIGLLDETTHEEFGSNRLPRLTVAKGDEWLFTTREYTLDAYEFRETPLAPYKYPTEVVFYGGGRGYTLRGTYKAHTLFNVTDIIGELPEGVQEFVLLFMDRPVYYRNLGVFEGFLTHPDGRVELLNLIGPYEYLVLK